MATTEVKEHPMLFAGRMAQAVHDGSKTQTRRPITAKNCTVLGYPGCQFWDHLLWDRKAWVDGSARGVGTIWDGPRQAYDYLKVAAWNPADGEPPESDDDLCYYRVRPTIFPGDRIWVRETWGDCGDYDGRVLLDGRKALYRAAPHEPEPRRWRPSIHMPRWACRTVLEVIDVRVERVQEISEEDALAEGFDDGFLVKERLPSDARVYSFREYAWEPAYEKTQHAWKNNPWVFVYEFHKV